jgi:hypothetical protein
MTMESYQWQRKHLSSPPATLSIMRTLPEGDWTVRCEGWVFPPRFATTYDELETAMRAGDEVLITHLPHDCARQGCGEWMPAPPAPPDTPTAD